MEAVTNPLPLFDPARAAHARDPATSFKAAEQAEGLAARHHKLILDHLRKYTAWELPQTYEQIADGTGLKPVQVNRRLIELKRAGLIIHFGEAMLSSRRYGRTWKAA